MIDLDYPKMLDLFRQHLDPKRTESASFLIWYLQNYYRLDEIEAIDNVCDQPGDKGIDGIFVNDADETITIFQAKISQNAKAAIGDKPLREFVGSVSQFQSADSIRHLIATAGDARVGKLAKELDLENKIAIYELRGEFLSNVELDANGAAFLKTAEHIVFFGKETLAKTYISDERNIPDHGLVKFDISGIPKAEYIVDANTRTVIAPIKATELVKMDGIDDQSIFAFNVRGPLGRTKVNKDIVATIRDAGSHKMFPLFHNGITVIAETLASDDATISAQKYFVVNGCQSLTALHGNRKFLTDSLRVLVKFIKMDPGSEWAARITRFSNNQNGVKARDFKANDANQIRLQNEFSAQYPGEYAFEIKRGETDGKGAIISNEDAGLYLMAFDLKEPWGTHRKYEVFEEKYADLFGRPAVNADRIVMLKVIVDSISDAVEQIENGLFAKYVLTKYMLLYIVRRLLESDEMADVIANAPGTLVRQKGNRENFRRCIDALVGDIIVSLNLEVEEIGEDFDYRGNLRDASWVKRLADRIVADHLKMIKRKSIKSFAEDWASGLKEA